MYSNSKRLLDVNIIFNKANKFGLLQDAELIKQALSGKTFVKFVDPLEQPSIADINIHLEIPIYSFVPWASYNIFVMNPEWYVNESFDPYMKHFDKIITKEDLSVGTKLPWTFPPFNRVKKQTVKEFLYLLGGSKNKRTFAQQLLPLWKESYPAIHVYSVEPLFTSETILPSNVKLYVEDLTRTKRLDLLQTYEGHVCCSMAEGFGVTAAEAMYVNAFTILNTLPVYQQDYKDRKNVAWIQTTVSYNERYKYGSFVTKTTNLESDLDSAISRFTYENGEVVDKLPLFKKGLVEILDSLPMKNKLKTIPPVLERKDCPPISVVTLIYNRRKFFDLARHNMILTDYPKDKIQWILVDDSDILEEQASDKIIQTKNQFTGMDIMYVPLYKKTPISQKRNIGIERATNDIILFMDDDDHYPETSFRRRVAWLTKHPLLKPKAVAATTIACYDLLKGVSAVNCPPFDIPLGQRISEATLTFYKSWYEAQKFESDIQIGEGECFIKGRESEVLELPPQQIIVAFSHKQNISNRRIPASDDIEPSCFWGFPKEYLVFIHSLAGVNVVNS